MTITTHTYDNGLTLLVEPIADVASAAMTLLLPAGAAAEDGQGTASLLSEWIFRGAGDLDARGHSEALDQLGVKRDSAVTAHHHRIGATMLGDRLDAALGLMLDMAMRPRLDDGAFGPSRDLAIQAIDALDDEPQRKVMIELRRAHLPARVGRSSLGRRDHLQSMTADDARAFASEHFVPGNAILGIAGNVDPRKVIARVDELTQSWRGNGVAIDAGQPSSREHRHVHAESTQQHIGLACDAPPETHPDSMTLRVGMAALSGGMSARLFTEVREKRGLCYAVMAAYQTVGDLGVIGAYAGTTVDRARQTLEVTRQQMQQLAEGVDDDEFERAVAGLKSRLVMQGESTSARAAAIAGDQFLLGRPRSLDELAAEIDKVTLDKLNACLAAHKLGPFTTVNIGPKPLGD